MGSACFIFMNIVANLASLPSMYHRRTADSIILGQFDPTIHVEENNESANGERGHMEALASRLRQSHMQFNGSISSKEDSSGLQSFSEFVSDVEESNVFPEDKSSYGTTVETKRHGAAAEDEGSATYSPLLGRGGIPAEENCVETSASQAEVRRKAASNGRDENSDIAHIFGHAMVAASDENFALLNEICASKRGTVTRKIKSVENPVKPYHSFWPSVLCALFWFAQKTNSRCGCSICSDE